LDEKSRLAIKTALIPGFIAAPKIGFPVSTLLTLVEEASINNLLVRKRQPLFGNFVKSTLIACSASMEWPAIRTHFWSMIGSANGASEPM